MCIVQIFPFGNEISQKLFFICKITREAHFDVRASTPGDRKFAASPSPPPLSRGEGARRQLHQQYQQQQLLQAAAS